MTVSVSYPTITSVGPYTITFEYVQPGDLKVFINDVQTTAYTLVSPSQIQLNVAPTGSPTLVIQRVTSVDAPAVDFADGSASQYSSTLVNRAFRQLLFRCQELSTGVIPPVTPPSSSRGPIDVTAYGAVGDFVADDTAAFVYCLYLAEISGRPVYVPALRYKMTGGLEVPESVEVYGVTAGDTQLNSTTVTDKGSCLIFVGTGPKNKTLDFVSNMDKGGGVLTNPAFGQPGISAQLSPTYELTNFTQANAVAGVKRADLKPFSVAVHILPGGGTKFRGIRVVPGRAGDGLAIYRDTSYAGLADNWDVGIWVDNHHNLDMNGASAVGYWRMIGKLESCVGKTVGGSPSNEYNSYINCKFQGGIAGCEDRGPDKFLVTAVTANTVETAFSASHRFIAPYDSGWTGSSTFRKSTTSYTYTGVTFATDKMTFTGVASTAGIVVGDKIRPTGGVNPGNFGFSGTTYFNCRFIGLGHASRLLATSPSLTSPFPYASSGYKGSGDPFRERRFQNCTFLGSDEVAFHLHDCNDVAFMMSYGEGQTARSVIGGAFDIPSGGRAIASPFEGDSTAPYPAGETGQLLDIGSNWNESVDFRPQYASSNVTRFGSYGGLFNPRSMVNLSRKAMPAADAAKVFHLPPGDVIQVGDPQNNSDVEVQAISGELIIGSSTETSNFVIKNGVVSRMRVGLNGIRPATDNSIPFGAPSARATQLFAVSGTINTSDIKEKQGIEDIAEVVLDAIDTVRPVLFRWIDSVQRKGEDARTHAGYIAQHVEAAFEAFDLDPFEFGVLGRDWVTHEFDQATGKDIPLDEPFWRYNLRMDQLCVLVNACTNRRLTQLETRVSTLEA